MIIKQLGNGGAFDYDQTNSSFLIDTKKGYFLFDCGSNVFDELMLQSRRGDIDISKIKYVYISHMHDDHVGSLQTLIYYSYFVIGKKIRVMCAPDLQGRLQCHLQDLDGYFENHRKIETDMYELDTIPSNDLIELDEEIKVKSVPVNHGMDCSGLLFRGRDDKSGKESFLVISGDTKYSSSLERELSTYIQVGATKVILHDYSNWDNEGSQIHCCKSDYYKYASHGWKWLKYHNGDKSFSRHWTSLDDIKDQRDGEGGIRSDSAIVWSPEGSDEVTQIIRDVKKKIEKEFSMYDLYEILESGAVDFAVREAVEKIGKEPK